jgi:hypothetical protein
MNRKLIALAFAAATLSACVRPVIEQAKEDCVKIGVAPGDQQWLPCVLQEQVIIEQRAANESAALLGAAAGYTQWRMQQPMMEQRPTTSFGTTTCSSNGLRGFTCNSF